MKIVSQKVSWLWQDIPRIYRRFHNKTDCNLIYVLIRFIFYRIAYKKNIIAHNKTKIIGIKNIHIKGVLEIGVSYFGLLLPSDYTFLNIRGRLVINSSYSIGRGCRFDVGENAVVEIGKNGHITAFTTLIISHRLIIGDNCAISWNCQFLDDDRQTIEYEGKIYGEKEIIIGNHVWIGSGAQIYEGTQIPDGCVVASNSVVRGVFTTQNAIIGGNPARVIKKNVNWK